MSSEGEVVVLRGIAVPAMVRLEVAGADRAHWRVHTRVPEFLGGHHCPAEDDGELVCFVRTEERSGPYAVFRPEDR